MLTYLYFFMIFVGVTISLYQVYSIHYDINFEDEERRSGELNESLKELSAKAREYSETGVLQGFIQAVQGIFGRDFDYRIVLAAFNGDNEKDYAEPLVRRRKKVVTNGAVEIIHLPFWKTSPPEKDIRGVVLSFIVANTLLPLFWGAVSICTATYPVSMESLAWVNDEFTLMVLVYCSVLITYAASRFDVYMHDLYQIGKLNEIVCASQDKSKL